MEEPTQIKSGISIQIRRTDGRTHPAIVSTVNADMRSVTVEWFEKGETKGKEIEFDAIYALNVHLLPANLTSQCDETPNKLSRGSSNVWEDGEDDDDEIEIRTDGLTADGDNGNTKENKPASTLSMRSLPNPQTYSTKTALPVVSGRGKSTRPSFALSNGHVDVSRRGIENISSLNAQVPQNKVVCPPPPPATVDQLNPVRSRRSNVVKEVEKLKKNREERRQRQAEKKEEKEALMNMDPGNPNWQFLGMIREYQSSLEFRPLRETDPVECHQITVCVRKRPLNKKEIGKKEVDVVTVPRKDMIVVHEPKNKVDLTKYLENQQFRFDYAFDETCTNELVYKYTARPLVQTIFEGGMATCFAYGQTGSGKTHTMGGTFSGKIQDCKKGIYAMVAKDVFQFLSLPQYKNSHFVVSSSFFEIYSGKVFDLLAGKAKLRVLEDGKQQVQIVGLTEKVVTNVEEVLSLIQAGNQARTSGQTSANSNSSRSHAVFQLIIRYEASHKIHGKFSLIDLAGNERGADTSSANRLTRMEGAEINKSLLALKECIRALGRKGAHLPFRASKLTQVLRDSFIGDNSKTCMIAMISPGMSSCEHSLNTLRYADRVKELAATDPSMVYFNDAQDIYSQQILHQESDLAALRSLNEGEISADLYNFHKAISQLQQQEEDIIDSLKTWHENSMRWDDKEAELLAMTQNVDYDQDAFASELDSVFADREKMLTQLRDKVITFRQQLLAEEEMSKKMTPPNPTRF